MTRLSPHAASFPSHPTRLVNAIDRLPEVNKLSFPTLGHRYFTISFIIAQSAFLCSLLATVVSLSRSFFGDADAAVLWTSFGFRAGVASTGRDTGGACELGGFRSDGVSGVDCFRKGPFPVEKARR
jgi:hypothetical protein